MGKYDPSEGRQRSLAERANEQLNGTGHRDRFGEAIEGAAKPDCLNGDPKAGLLNLAMIPYNSLTKKCN
jgi:hypothetical protein